MPSLRYLLLFYALSAIFVAGGLFFKRSGQTYLTLSLFLLLFGIEMLDFLYSTSQVVRLYPVFYARYYFIAGFLYGPILYFHFQALLDDRRFHRRQLWHFLPALIIGLSMLNFLLLPGTERMAYTRTHFLDRIMPYNYTRALHILLYGLVFILMIRRRFAQLKPQRRLYALSFCAIYFVTAVFISWLTAFASGWRQFIYYYFAATTLVVLTGVILYWYPGVLKTISQKYLSSKLELKDRERIKAKLEKAFEQQQLYLQPGLTLAEVGKLIGEKPNDISQTLSSLVELNFNAFVNRYRVAYARRILQDPDYDRYSIEGIALESGFGNKVTFHRAFRQFDRQRPSTYRENRKKE